MFMAKSTDVRNSTRKIKDPVKASRDNRANQLNPNNRAYWSSRRTQSR